MLRFLFNLIAILLMAVVILGGYLWYKRTPLLVRHLAKELGVTVCADELRIGWNRLELKNLTILNPSEGVVPYLFAAQSISIDLPFSSLLKQPTHIPLIVVDNCIVGMELYNTTGSQNSWTELFATHQETTTPASIRGNATEYEPQRRVIVDDLVMNNLYLDLYSTAQQRQISIPGMKRVELTNVGAGAGMPLGSAVELVLNQLAGYLFNNLDLEQIIINAMRGLNMPTLEKAVRRVGQAVRGQAAPTPVSKPDIPRGRYCYSPGGSKS